EGLGKAGRGSTPVAARGPADQHSQLQLWVDGPDDKVFVVLGVADRDRDVAIPDGNVLELGYLAGRRLGDVVDAELAATCASLAQRNRPVGRLSISRLTAEAVGELAMLFEAASLFAGPMYGVDPIGEPGVEEQKRLVLAALGGGRAG